VAFLVAGLAPVRFVHVFGPTHRERTHTAFDTFRDDSVRQRMVTVRLALCELPTRPQRRLRRAVLTLRVNETNVGARDLNRYTEPM
jgi:hypothetical protein